MIEYYFANEEKIFDVYGDQTPVCVDKTEAIRLAKEWATDFEDIWHEATADEIAEYGAYDS